MGDKENRELQALNARLDEYIKKIKAQASNQQGPEMISIYDLIEGKMETLWSKVNQEKETTEELEFYKKRVKAEEERRKDVEKLVDNLTTEKITAQLDSEFQKKRNGLLKQEITYLKEIYEKTIRELQIQRQQNQTETDASRDERNVVQDIREKKLRLTLGKQKEKITDMEKQFKTMIENLTGYEEAVNKKLDLQEEIDKYEKLLEQMKKRVEDSSKRSPNEGTPKTPSATGNKNSTGTEGSKAALTHPPK